MKRNKLNLVMATVIGFSLTISACGNPQSQEKSTDKNVQNKQMNDTEEVSQKLDEVVGVSKEEAQKILTIYLEIKNALVQTDGEAASEAAKRLVTEIGETNDELVGKIRFDAEHIAETKDTKHQRDHFNLLSDNVYTIVKATNANDGKLYRQHCPMAMDNKGAYWLSMEEEVKNPYFGNMMLHCGSVKETLN